MRGKRALITGVTGQDGALLAKYLLGLGYEVWGMMRRTSSPTDWRLKEMKLYNNGSFHVVSGDLTDFASISNALDESEPDEVYNLAANSFVGASWDYPAAMLDVTGVGPVRLFECVRRHEIEHNTEVRVYQASSSEMYGGCNIGTKLDEMSDLDPKSPYAIAKVAAHNAAHVYRDSYKMFIACGILFNHTGEYRGEQFVERKISLGVAKIHLGFADYIELGNMDAKRDFGYAAEYVVGMHKMLQQGKPDDYVLATGHSYSIREILYMAFHRIGIDITSHLIHNKYIHTNSNFMRPNEVHNLTGNAEKAIRVLDWYPKVDMKDVVGTMVHHDLHRLTRNI